MNLINKTNVDLLGERRGFFPTYEWYKETYGPYTNIKGQKVNISIGQGEILVSPLQMCSNYMLIANKGIAYQPHFLKTVVKESEDADKYSLEYSVNTVDIPSQDWDIIHESLYAVVNEAWGTGLAAQVPGVNVYGKTGSAENHQGEETHAWFCGFAGWEEPEIVFTVFLENAGHGGSVAAPIAGKIIKFYKEKMRD